MFSIFYLTIRKNNAISFLNKNFETIRESFEVKHMRIKKRKVETGKHTKTV